MSQRANRLMAVPLLDTPAWIRWIEGDRRLQIREDGSIAGEGSYIVAEDGTTMTATTAGFDSQLRRFEMRTVWDRI